MSQFYTVIRPFEGVRPYTPGEVVDASAWRTTQQLVAMRLVRAATVEELSAATAPAEAQSVPARRGRPANAAE